MAQEPKNGTCITETVNEEGIILKYKVVPVAARETTAAPVSMGATLKTRLCNFFGTMPPAPPLPTSSPTGQMTKTIMAANKPGGICLAMTVLWLKGILLEGHVEYTATTQQATVLFGMYSVLGNRRVKGARVGKEDMWAARHRAFAIHGLKMKDGQGEHFFGDVEEAFEWIRAHASKKAFSIRVPGHAIAAYINRGKAYYFDPNWGVYRYASVSDFSIYAYLHARFEYCTWDASPLPNEVSVIPITAGA